MTASSKLRWPIDHAGNDKYRTGVKDWWISQTMTIFLNLAQWGLGLGLPPCQVASWSIQPFGHNTPRLQTDRQDRQRSDSIGQTVLRKVAQYFLAVAVKLTVNQRRRRHWAADSIYTEEQQYRKSSVANNWQSDGWCHKTVGAGRTECLSTVADRRLGRADSSSEWLNVIRVLIKSQNALRYLVRSWFKAGSKLVADRFEAGSNLSATSFKPASYLSATRTA